MISRKNILELEPRKNIYSYISKNPGLHLREISRRLEIPYATLKYHLRYLEKQDLITTKFENEYKRYFVTNKLGKKEKGILVFLRQEVPSNILIYLMFHYVFSQTEISVALGKEPSTIDFHLKKLKKAEIIEVLPKKPNFDDGWTEEYGYGLVDARLLGNLYSTDRLDFGNVKPGETVTESFMLRNNGYDGQSDINWKIDTEPNWGEWTFNPSSGNLEPDEEKTISVELIVPNTPNTGHEGIIYIRNEDDFYDCVVISYSASTSRNRVSHTLFLNLLQNYPNLFPLLQLLLKL